MMPRAKNDIVFFEVFREEAAALKKLFLPKVNARFCESTIQESRPRRCPSFISIRTQSVIPPSWASTLRGILSRSTGYDHLSAYRRETNTPAACGYLPAYCSRAVAEHAILIMMALWRKLPGQISSFPEFNRHGLTGSECFGKNLLVVGVGRIGQEIVRMARGLGLRVKGVDLVSRMKSCEYVSLARGLSWAHAVICAVPLTPLTRGMLGYQQMKKCRPGLIVVNVSRGEVTPAGDLCRMMDAGIVAGAGLDVFENEDRVAAALRRGRFGRDALTKPLFALKQKGNVIFTPHNAFNTHQALQEKALQSVEATLYFLRRGRFPHPVPDDPPVARRVVAKK